MRRWEFQHLTECTTESSPPLHTSVTSLLELEVAELKYIINGSIFYFSAGFGMSQGFRDRYDIINHGHEKKPLCVFFIDLYLPR